MPKPVATGALAFTDVAASFGMVLESRSTQRQEHATAPGNAGY